MIRPLRSSAGGTTPTPAGCCCTRGNGATGAAEDLVHEAFVALASQRRPPANPTAWLFTTVRNAARSADRKAAELQLIEALRDHVAKRGSAPRDLSALQLPAPLDPATGNPFGYSGNANTITIDAQIPKDGRDRAEQHYVITLEK